MVLIIRSEGVAGSKVELSKFKETLGVKWS